MKKFKVFIFLPLPLILIYMCALGIYSEISFKQRGREIKTFTDDQLKECIKENQEKKLARNYDTYGSISHLSSDTSDRRLWEAQCLYENDSVGRFFSLTEYSE